jgi:ribosome-associated translation inhibitor RaiA
MMVRGVVQGLKKNRRALVMFLLGFLIGNGLFLLLYGEKIDGMLSERNAMYYANNQKYKEILKLQEEIVRLAQKGERYRENQDRIQKIVVEVDSEQSVITDLVKEQIEKKLTPFLGKSMQWISNNPDLIEVILEKEQIVIDESQKLKVEVHLKYVSFYDETLKIWIQTKDISSDDVSNIVK